MMTTLPPERDLPGADRMVDDIILGAETAEAAPARKPYLPYLALAASVTLVALGVVAVQMMGNRPTIPAGPGPSSPSAPITTVPTTPAPTTSSSGRPTGPVTLTAQLGETVKTRYFDVTVSALEADDEGLAWGAKVEVCYAATHPEQNADGTTRTSIDQWYFSVQDGEGGGPGEWVKVKNLPPSTRWSPVYKTKLVKLGQCNTGWVQAEPGSPDLFFPNLRYAPADFGDDIVWNWPGTTDPGTPDRPTGPVKMTAELGETVRTRYFDVTVTALEADEDGLAWAAKAEVCYAVRHPEERADGTTRTSVDPWYFSVQDGEVGGPAEWVKVKDLQPSTRWSPVYGTKLVGLGECNSGWVQAEPGSPDLFFPSLRYAPADFGDDIRWVRPER